MSDPLFVGIDAGSSATKCVIVDSAGEILSHAVTSSGFDFMKSAERVFDQALRDIGAEREQMVYCVSTGYGRGNVSMADRQVTEITCHAQGAKRWYPGVRHIIDIGGQDTKIMHLDADGQLEDFRMNAKCAAGTGTFLESIAMKLGLRLAEIDALALRSSHELILNSYCTVFAGTEVIECVKAGKPAEDIAMGLFRSIASRIREMIPHAADSIAATGGVVAHCRAMVCALQNELRAAIQLPPLPQHAGAYGAALIALRSRVEGDEGDKNDEGVSTTVEPGGGCESC